MATHSEISLWFVLSPESYVTVFTKLCYCWNSWFSPFYQVLESLQSLIMDSCTSRLGLLRALLVGTGCQHGQFMIVSDEHFPPLVPLQQMCPVQMSNSCDTEPRGVSALLNSDSAGTGCPACCLGVLFPPALVWDFPLTLTTVCAYAQFD